MRNAMAPVGRGVWVAPWIGPSGEVVLLAMSRDKRLLGEPLMVPIGENHVRAGESMWARVDRDDPMPDLKII